MTISGTLVFFLDPHRFDELCFFLFFVRVLGMFLVFLDVFL